MFLFCSSLGWLQSQPRQGGDIGWPPWISVMRAKSGTCSRRVRGWSTSASRCSPPTWRRARRPSSTWSGARRREATPASPACSRSCGAEHDPEKLALGLDPGWRPVFGQDHAQARGVAVKSIDEANQDALKRILDGDPHLVDVIPAAQAIPELKDRTILHAGPPISWERMCGPLRG